MIKLEVKEATKDLNKLAKQLSDKQVAGAARMALNEAARKGRTEVRRAVTSIYNIKSGRINDPNPKKGLTIKLATDNNLTSEIRAGHVPTRLADADPKFKSLSVLQNFSRVNGKVKKGQLFSRSKSQVSVEIYKGRRKTLATAFLPGIVLHKGSGDLLGTKQIFARGKRGKPGFQFGSSRYPIDVLSSVSIATAALNVGAKDKYTPIVESYMEKRFIHHLKRQTDKI